MRSGFCCSMIISLIVCAPLQGYDWTTNPGDGSESNPYQISEPNHLMAIGSDPNLYNQYKHFTLTSNITFDPNNNPSHVFGQAVIPTLKGSLNGRGFTIENLKISVGTYNNEPVGLIGTYGDHGNCRLENLNIQNAEITVGDDFQRVGILCGLNQLLIHNCQASGTIVCGNGSTKIGGICGSNGEGFLGGLITHCRSNISISSSSATGTIEECGGICGYNARTVVHCSADGNVNARTLRVVGGICGLQEGPGAMIISCDTSVDITAQRSLYHCGGLCGRNREGTISHSYATGYMTSVETHFYGYATVLYVGGFCGWNTQGIIESCYSTGDVSCESVESGGGEESGGFCGRNSGSGEIRDCFSTGDIICGPITGDMPPMYKSRWVGGFCGTNEASIINCYSTGTVDTDVTEKAGFCYTNNDTMENSFWDTTTSDISTGIVSGNLTGAEGKMTGQMQDPNTFLNAGWDFIDETNNGEEDIWGIETGHYPEIHRQNYSGGNGSPQNPFQISSPQDLINLGKSEENHYDCFVLTNDIDLSGRTFDDAVISQATEHYDPAFMGSLDGQGYIIDHLTIHSNASDKDYIGLFGLIGSLGEVNRLSLQNISISGANMNYVGGLCGLTRGIIKQCSIGGSIQVNSTVGGISAFNTGWIHDCYATGVFNGTHRVGGICGRVGYLNQSGKITNCYSNASIQSGTTYEGGLVGYLDGVAQLVNCFWDTTTSGLSSGYYLESSFFGIIENVEGYTTQQMKQKANFTGWDFLGEDINGKNEIWRMCAGDVDYPRLSWEFAKNGDFVCGDGVDILDLQALAEEWMTAADITPTTFNYACDANGDEKIDLSDFSVLGNNW